MGSVPPVPQMAALSPWAPLRWGRAPCCVVEPPETVPSPMWALLQLLPRATCGLFCKSYGKAITLTKRSPWLLLALKKVVDSGWTSPVSHAHVNCLWLVTPSHAADGAVPRCGAVPVQCLPAWLREQPSQAHLSALSEW